MSAIAIEWHPVKELLELLEVAESELGRNDGNVARAIGARGAEQSTRGFVKRSLFYLAKPDFLLRRIAGLWLQFNDQGAMHLRHLDERRAVIEVTGVPNPHRLFCATLTGWVEVMARAVGAVGSVVEHGECRARGQSKCLWYIKWDAASSENTYPAS